MHALERLNALFEQLPETAEQAAKLAVNGAARFARRQASKMIREEVAFRPRYLGNDEEGALSIVKFASKADDDAVIRGRNDARSLASFATNRPAFGKPGVKVRVAPGKTQTLNGGFLIRLRRGTNDIDAENYNTGLAIRLKKGERVTNKRQMKAIGSSGLYLLYGPSVAQVFDDVAVEMQPAVTGYLVTEFVRQFERLSHGQ